MLKAVEVPLWGHPDKVCDYLVESVVDEYVKRDALAKLDIQALGTQGMIMLGGVVDSRADFDVADVARRAYAEIGYNEETEVFSNLEKSAVEKGRPQGVRGAQGTAIVYGYATRETREMLPPAVVYARSIAERIDELRVKDDRFAWLRPDGKVQLVMQDGRVTDVTVIACHDERLETQQVQSLLFEHAVAPMLSDAEGVKVLINPFGPFTAGGFALNAGVSGRKVLSDMYGGLLPHGGVALTGKDPLKPARAGTYMARYVARQLVRDGVADSVLLSAVYSVGVADPVGLSATSGDGEDLTAIVRERFDFRPEAIVERFNLRRPLYASSARHGLFGRASVPWEE